MQSITPQYASPNSVQSSRNPSQKCDAANQHPQFLLILRETSVQGPIHAEGQTCFRAPFPLLYTIGGDQNKGAPKQRAPPAPPGAIKTAPKISIKGA